MAHQRRQDVQRPRLDHQLVVLGAEALRHLAGIGQLVEVALAEANREGLHRRAAELGHLGHHRARIHAAAEERTQRHIGHQPSPHGVAEELTKACDGVLLGNAQLLGEAHVPVRLDRRASVLPHETMAGRQLLHVTER